MSVDLWSVVPFAGSLRINIELEQTTPSTSLNNYGASQVNYKIYVPADSGGYSYYDNKIYLKIGNEVVCDIDSQDYHVHKPLTIKQGTTSTYFQRQENGYLNIPCVFQFQGRRKSSTLFTYNHTFFGDSFQMYTKCGAPTAFTCTSLNVANGGISKPQNLDFTWSGATGGTHVDIEGYTIYYKIASSLTFPTISDNNGTIDVDSGSETSTTWLSGETTLENNRGKYIAFKILTKGNVEGYDSDLSSISFYIKVNTIPTVPTVTYNSSSVTSIVLNSSTSSVTFGVSGSTDIDSQAITYHYGSSKTLINNNQVTINSITTNTNISFYAKDGLEYSNAKTVSITKNVKPSIVSITLTGTSYKANNATYVKQISATVSVNKASTGTVAVEAIIRADSSTSTVLKTTQLSSKSVSSSKTAAFTSLNIQQILGSSLGETYNSSKVYWVSFNFIYNDTIEQVNSTVSTVTINSTSYGIRSAAASTEKTVWNRFNTSNVSNTTPGEFYDKVRVRCYDDTSLNTSNYTCNAKFGNVTYPLTFSMSTSGNYRYFDITFSTIPPSDSSGTITITGTDGYITKTVTTATIKETKVPYMGGTFSSTIGTIYMFNSQPSSYTNTLAWPFGQYTDYTEPCAQEYNLNKTATTAIKIRLSYGNFKKDCSITALTKSGDNLSSQITPNNLFDWTTSPINLIPYQGIKNLTIQYVITNLFGQEFVSASKTIQFNFNRQIDLQNATISLRYADTGTSQNPSAIGNKRLQEGAFLYFDITSLKLYTTEQFTLNIYAQSSGGSTVLPKTLRKTIVYSQGQSEISYGSGYGNAGSNDLENILYGQLPQLGASSYIFTIEIIGQYSGTVSKATTSISAIKRAPSNTILQSCSYSNGNWTYQAIRDDGLGGTSIAGVSAIYQLCNSQGDLVSNTNLTQDSGTITSTITLSGSIYLKIKTTITLDADASGSVVMINKKNSNAYVYYSTLVIVYANTATVAYRVHSIGINTRSIENKGIVEIHGIDGRDQIVLKNQTSSVSNSAVLDLTTLNLNLVKTVVSTSSTTSVAIDLMNLGKITSSATTAKTYLFAGTCTTGAQSVYTNASCYMSNGHLYSNTKQVASINTAAQTATSSYYLKGSSAQNGVELQTHASCYMLGGYLYSGGTKVDMGELYKLNPTTNANKRYLTAVENTTGTQLVNTNGSCYMSGGYLYSGGAKVNMAELYKLNPTVTISSVYIPGVLNTTGAQVVYTNASCYMSNGFLYSGGIKTLVTPREDTDWNDVNYLIGYRENEEQPIFEASCYTFEEYLYSNGERVISQEDMLIVPLYIKPSGTTGYSVGVIRFYKSYTKRMAIAEFNSYGASGTIPMESFNLLFPGTNTTYVLPSFFRPTSSKTIINLDNLYKGDSKSASYTTNSKLSLVINEGGTITLTVSGATIGNDGWQRRGHIIY